MSRQHEELLESVGNYYAEKLREHGTTARGVDWNSEASQKMRFEQLIKICQGDESFSINDYGCGYGQLARFLSQSNLDFEYCGFDICAAMIDAASRYTDDLNRCTFVSSAGDLQVRDYTVASGVFNVKQRTDQSDWQSYVLDSIHQLADVSRRGFSFNLLTHHADKEYMRTDLYYGDPIFFFEHCRTTFGRHVALLHDYPLYEFTILVRLQV